MPCPAVAFPSLPPTAAAAAGRKPRSRLPAFLRPVPPPPRRGGQPYGTAGTEPPLEELLADPLVHLVLARDGLTVETVRREMLAARRRLTAP